MTSYRSSCRLSPRPAPTHRTTARPASLRYAWPAILLGCSLSWSVTPAGARDGDGVVVLSWTGAESISSGTSRIVQSPIPAGELTVVLIGSGRERVHSLAAESPIRIDGIDPGEVTLELRHGMGILAVWETVVRAEISTPVELDLARGLLAVSPVSPDPFGSWEVWTRKDMRGLPGLAQDGLRAHDTRAVRPQDPRLDGIEFARKDRLRPQSIDLDQAIVGAQRPLGSSPAYRSGHPGLHLLTRPLPGRGVRVGGSAGNGNRFLGHAQLKDRYSTRSGDVLDLSGQIQFSAFDVAGPLEALNADLDHDDETALEVRARASYDQRMGRLRAEVYALGSERNYHLNEFAENLAHAPKEDRGSLGARLAYDLRLGAQDLTLDASYGREFTETGDGTAFDEFLAYNRATNLPDTGDDGLFWLGDDPATGRDEGRLFDYYERSLVEDLGLRADLVRDLVVPGGFRTGAEVHWTRWRLYEHLRPSRVVASGDSESGYTGVTRNFGYSVDGDERNGDAHHAPRQARQVALFASQRIAFGKASFEAGVRLDRFSPGQNPLLDLADPLGSDRGAGDPATLDRGDLGARPDHDLVSPRLGVYTPLGSATHLWVDGGRRQIVPPFQAVYYDGEFLQLEAALAEDTANRPGAALIHGNPGLAPEDEWSGQLGIYHRRSANLGVRVSGYASRTADTWVARSYTRTLDSIDFYENGGERRELGVHLGLALGNPSSSQIHVQYDLSRTETDVIEPYPLYEHLRHEELPIGSVANPQTRLRSVHWIDDGVDRGFFPSIWDRTHRLAAIWSRELRGLGGGGSGDHPSIGVAFRGASGAPYTRTFVRSEGDLAESTDTDSTTDPDRRTGEVHGERLPASWQIDFIYTQPLTVIDREVGLRVEVRNLTDRQNAQYVHPATGKADDDGWLATSAGQQTIDERGSDFESDYRTAIESPLHYTEGLNARISMSVALF